MLWVKDQFECGKLSLSQTASHGLSRSRFETGTMSQWKNNNNKKIHKNDTTFGTILFIFYPTNYKRNPD